GAASLSPRDGLLRTALLTSSLNDLDSLLSQVDLLLCCLVVVRRHAAWVVAHRAGGFTRARDRAPKRLAARSPRWNHEGGSLGEVRAPTAPVRRSAPAIGPPGTTRACWQSSESRRTPCRAALRKSNCERRGMTRLRISCLASSASALCHRMRSARP